MTEEFYFHYFNVNERSHCPAPYLVYEAPTPSFENISPGVLTESVAGCQPRARVGACASCSTACLPVPPGGIVTRWAPRHLGCSGVGLGGRKQPWSHCFSPHSASFGLALASAFWPDCTASHRVRAAAAPVPKVLLPSLMVNSIS